MAGQVPPPNVHPWNNPGAVNMPAPLHALPKSSEIWLPKFNPDDGLLAEEHIHNYMLTINLKEVVEEDCVVRLFPYTLIGSARSWYFSLPARSITSWSMLKEQFLGKFGDDRSTASLIKDLSNLKAKTGEKIKDFNSRFNKFLNKIPSREVPGVEF